MSPSVRATISRKFDVSAESVFDAWLDPAWIGCWMAESDGRVVRLGVEPRIGGRFSFVVDRRGRETDHGGKYLELDRPHLLVFTWSARDRLPVTSRVIVEILPLAGGCELTLTHVLDVSHSDSTDETTIFWNAKLRALADAFTETKFSILNPS